MTRAKKGPAKRTTGPHCGSTEQESAAISVRTKCLEELRRIAEDAQNFKIRLFHAPEDWETRAWSIFPSRKTEWMRQSADTIRTYVGEIREIFLNVDAMAKETNKSLPLFKVHLHALFATIREIFERAGEGASSHPDDEKRWESRDVESTIKRQMAECELEISRAITGAFKSAQVWIPQEMDRRAQANTPPTRPSKLPPKSNILSKYAERIDAAKLTDMQSNVLSLRLEHRLSFTKIAKRLGKDPKTVREHFDAACRKIELPKGEQRR